MATPAIEHLTKDQLKGILRDLDVEAPESAKKEELVEMVLKERFAYRTRLEEIEENNPRVDELKLDKQAELPRNLSIFTPEPFQKNRNSAPSEDWFSWIEGFRFYMTAAGLDEQPKKTKE